MDETGNNVNEKNIISVRRKVWQTSITSLYSTDVEGTLDLFKTSC